MEIVDLKHLAGITGGTSSADMPAPPIIDGTEKARIMRERNIKPGTDEWFQLWFSRPHLTHEKPY